MMNYCRHTLWIIRLAFGQKVSKYCCIALSTNEPTHSNCVTFDIENCATIGTKLYSWLIDHLCITMLTRPRYITSFKNGWKVFCAIFDWKATFVPIGNWAHKWAQEHTCKNDSCTLFPIDTKMTFNKTTLGIYFQTLLSVPSLKLL